LSNLTMGQTILSSRGAGTPFPINSARSMGMGSLSIAMSDPMTINQINPAALYRVPNTRISLEYFMEQNSFETEAGKTTSRYSNFNGFSFVLPLGSGLGFSTGLTPITRMEYDLAFNGMNGGMPYTKSIEGTGGLNAFFMSMFFTIKEKFAVGFSWRYIFGNLKEIWNVKYDNSEFIESYDTFTTNNNGFGYTLGVLYSPIKNMEIGFIYSPQINLNNDTETYATYFSLLDLSNIETSGSIQYPSIWGVGASHRIFKTIQLGAEYTRTNWTDLEINENKVVRTNDSHKLAIGFEIRKTLNPNASLLERIAYRMGYSTQPYFYHDIAGNDMKEHWISAGLGIPLFHNASQVDIAFQYGVRGHLKTNGIKENLMRLNLSVSGGERWFIQRY